MAQYSQSGELTPLFAITYVFAFLSLILPEITVAVSQLPYFPLEKDGFVDERSAVWAITTLGPYLPGPVGLVPDDQLEYYDDH